MTSTIRRFWGVNLTLIFSLIIQLPIYANPETRKTFLLSQCLAPSSKVNWKRSSDSLEELSKKRKEALERFQDISMGRRSFSEKDLLEAKIDLLKIELDILRLQGAFESKGEDESLEIEILEKHLLGSLDDAKTSIRELEKEKFLNSIEKPKKRVSKKDQRRKERKQMREAWPNQEFRSNAKKRTLKRKAERSKKEFEQNQNATEMVLKRQGIPWLNKGELIKTAYLFGLDIEKLIQEDKKEVSKIPGILNVLIESGKVTRSLFASAVTTYNLQRFEEGVDASIIDSAKKHAESAHNTARESLNELDHIDQLAKHFNMKLNPKLESDLESLKKDPLRRETLEGMADIFLSANNLKKSEDALDLGILVSFEELGEAEIPELQEGQRVSTEHLYSLTNRLIAVEEKFDMVNNRLKMLSEEEVDSIKKIISSIEWTIKNPPQYEVQLAPTEDLLKDLTDRLYFKIKLKNARSARTAIRARSQLMMQVAMNHEKQFFNASTQFGQMFLKGEEKKEKYELLSEAFNEGNKRLKNLIDAQKEVQEYLQKYESLARTPWGEDDPEVLTSLNEAGKLLEEINKELRATKTDMEGLKVHARQIKKTIGAVEIEKDRIQSLESQYAALEKTYGENTSNYEVLAQMHHNIKQRIKSHEALKEMAASVENIFKYTFEEEILSPRLEPFGFPNSEALEVLQTKLASLDSIYSEQMKDFQELLVKAYTLDTTYLAAVDKDQKDKNPVNMAKHTHQALLDKKEVLIKAKEAAIIVRDNAIERFNLEQLQEYEDIYDFAQSGVEELEERIQLVDSNQSSIEKEMIQNLRRMGRELLISMNKDLRNLTLLNQKGGRATKALFKKSQGIKAEVKALFDDLDLDKSMSQNRKAFTQLMNKVEEVEKLRKEAEVIIETRVQVFKKAIELTSSLARVSMAMALVLFISMGLFSQLKEAGDLDSTSGDDSAEKDTGDLESSVKEELGSKVTPEEKTVLEQGDVKVSSEKEAQVDKTKKKTKAKKTVKKPSQEAETKQQLDKIAKLLTEMANITIHEGEETELGIDVDKEIRLLQQYMKIKVQVSKLKLQMENQDLPEISKEVLKSIEEKLSLIENILPYLKAPHQKNFLNELSGDHIMEDAIESVTANKKLMNAIHQAA